MSTVNSYFNSRELIKDMVAVCVKIHKILTFIILTIVFISVVLLILLVCKGKKKISPENYLKNLGYEFELIDKRKVVIPNKFNDSMNDYNEMQKLKGFDLEKYAGKICTQLKYFVHKNSLKTKNATANLIVYDGNVVGGDLNEKYENKAKPL